ncbi:uncharacterized protein K452DRAFT_293063 [Aplosporella prunicola CBS 121167]|uniref:NmrA-like domain-containing protein n=1 Tax=Aplosporella prunicola CBS 121167 TaxID=1176127 RepID=A0A6A6AXH7_9PEZI|nr:uncharacterized protein K452DRAFT_293063 [Aplosporella prunicola CBS 121167]KAF2135644.1 hypothetical protein K452DRAFT_293063 [Aplosporella prunicola CBS 121167]
MSTTTTILVTGATGTQGRGTIRELLKLGHVAVRALVRDDTKPAAAELRESGVELAVGHFDDPTALSLALRGVDAVFINVSPLFNDLDAEARHGKNLVDAAVASGSVHTVVYSSVLLTGQHEKNPRWHHLANEGTRAYWLNKARVEQAVRSSSIRHRIILRPAHFMTNYVGSLGGMIFPELFSQGVLRAASTPTTPTMLISPDDIAKFAAAALTQPEVYNGQEIDLGVENLTNEEIAAALSRATGRQIQTQYIAPDKAEELAKTNPIISSQLFFNERSSGVDVAALRFKYGIPLQTFSEFLDAHKDDVKASFG